MSRILIPVDATDVSRFAIEHAIRRVRTGEALEIHLLNVQPRFSRHVAQFVSRHALDLFYWDRSATALTPATDLLHRAGIRCTTGVRRGDPALEIARCAESNGFSAIVMATRGMGSVWEMLLGSVTARVLRLSRVPVEVVPAHRRSSLRAYAGPAGLGAGILMLLYLAFD